MLLRLCALVALLLIPLAAQADSVTTLTAPDGTTVEIVRDEYGVPKIYAPTETAAFYGQGFAVAQDRLFQMETFWRVATGRMAEIQGADAVATDQAIRTVFYTPAERVQQFAALPMEIRDMLDAYIAGINAYIDLAEAEPDTYLPFEYTQFPLNTMPIERWDRDKAVATLQFFMRRFGEIGGEELTRLAELQAQGPEWFEANRPINDPEAYTSLWGGDALSATSRLAELKDGLRVSPDVVRGVQDRRQSVEDDLEAWGVPLKFGSFAALVRPEVSSTGSAMLLGAPQMGNPQPTEKAVTSEVEISVAGGIHIAGMTVPGIPGVIIGRVGTQENQRAWTLTTGATDNTDTYAEVLGEGGTSYFYNGEFQPFDVIVDQINVLGGDPVVYPHLRSVHGPVYAQDAENGLAFTWKYTFWDRELEMVEALYSAWHSESLADWQQVASEIPMSFNIFYADTDQNVAYWHVGTYPERPVDPRLPAMGDGSEEWLGFVDFSEHPQAVNFEQPYLVNWNNKPAAFWPQGDNVDWTDTPPGGYPRYFNGAMFLDDHLAAAAGTGDGITFEEVQELTRVVRSNPLYQEYPGTYQQVLAFDDGSVLRAENVIPPGQSGFVSSAGVPSPHFADQWPLYVSSAMPGPVLMKDFTFSADVEASIVPQAVALAAGVKNRIRFEVRSRNTTGATRSVRAATFVATPTGEVFGPLWGPREFTLEAGEATGPTTVRQTIPAGAPEGVYTLYVAVGEVETNDLIDVAAFDFTIGAMTPGKAARPSLNVAQPAPDGWDSAEVEAQSAPQVEAPRFSLDAPFPNPATGSVRVPFSLAVPGDAHLGVYDALGREVAVVARGQMEAGPQTLAFDASELAAGVYLLRLEAGGESVVRRLVITR
ncbi:MAG TPA: T9SS type A sorting domain-containing protein [Rhodothermales bacterium]|nr:T9SS type A sorting domain-containing protein [Rhodothermales bacterium]